MMMVAALQDDSSVQVSEYPNTSRKDGATLSQSELSLKTAQGPQCESVCETQQSMTDSLQSQSTGTTSLERRACRICQSETGEMVRPCGCTGTMGDIHGSCLSKWVASAPNPEKCEICKEKYAKNGSLYRPLKEWAKPQVNSRDLIGLITLLSLFFSMYYVICVMNERYFIERCFDNSLPVRADDVSRIVILLLFFVSSLGVISSFVKQIRVYLHRQRQIKFVNKDDVIEEREE